MIKFKKFYMCLLLIPIFISCTPYQDKYFSLNTVDESKLSYQFEMYGITSLNFALVKYNNNETENSIPLGQFTYNTTTNDHGSIDFLYTTSSLNKEVIKLSFNSEYFENGGDTKILDTDIDLSSYDAHFLVSDLQLNNSKEDIELIEFVQSDYTEDKYYIELDITF